MARTKVTPVVTIDPITYKIMSYWAWLGGKQSQEITCFALTSINEGKIHIEEALLVEQEGSGGSVEGDEVGIMKLMMELDKRGVSLDRMRCWVHSHPGKGQGATYLSGTDEENITRWLTGEYLVSIVFDSEGDNPYCRIDLKGTDLSPRISIDAKLDIGFLPDDVLQKAHDEFKAKVRKKTYVAPTYSGTGFGGYDEGGRWSSGRYVGGQGKSQSAIAGQQSGKSGGSASSKSSSNAKGGEIVKLEQGQARSNYKGEGGLIGYGVDDDTGAWDALAELAQQEGIDIEDIEIEFAEDIQELEREVVQKIDTIAEKVMSGIQPDMAQALTDIEQLGLSTEQSWDELKTRIME